jgi:hypothetical protein
LSVNSRVGWVKLLISPELYPPVEIITGGKLRAISFKLQAGERESAGSSGTARRAWGRSSPVEKGRKEEGFRMPGLNNSGLN